MRERQKPVRSEGMLHDDYRETHPSYATIGAYRVSTHPGISLFGSDFLHGHYVVIRIGEAMLHRGLSSDFVSGGSKLITEVALSEAQWATFVSSMNVGNGVPATLQFREGGDAPGFVPGIDPITNRREQFNAEIAEDLGEAITLMRQALAEAKTKTQRETIERAIKRLVDSAPFAAKRFDEHAEQTVEKAKMEVNAYVTQALMRAGAKALAGEGPVLELADVDPVNE